MSDTSNVAYFCHQKMETSSNNSKKEKKELNRILFFETSPCAILGQPNISFTYIIMMKTAAGCWIPKPRNDPLKCVCLHNYCAKPHTLWRNRNDTASPHVLDNSVFALSSFYRYRMLRFCACFIPKQQRQLKNAWKRRQNGNPIRGYQRREARWGGGGGGGGGRSLHLSEPSCLGQPDCFACSSLFSRSACHAMPAFYCRSVRCWRGAAVSRLERVDKFFNPQSLYASASVESRLVCLPRGSLFTHTRTWHVLALGKCTCL